MDARTPVLNRPRGDTDGPARPCQPEAGPSAAPSGPCPPCPCPRWPTWAASPLLAGQRRLAALFTARVAAGLALFVVVPGPGLVARPPARHLDRLRRLADRRAPPHPRSPRPAHPATSAGCAPSLAAVVIESGHALEATAPGPPRQRAGGSRRPTRPRGLHRARALGPHARTRPLRFRYRLMAWGLRHGRPDRPAPHPGRGRPSTSWATPPALALPARSRGGRRPTWLAMALRPPPSPSWPARDPRPTGADPSPARWCGCGPACAPPCCFSHDRHLEHHAYPEVPMPRPAPARRRARARPRPPPPGRGAAAMSDATTALCPSDRPLGRRTARAGPRRRRRCGGPVGDRWARLLGLPPRRRPRRRRADGRGRCRRRRPLDPRASAAGAGRPPARRTPTGFLEWIGPGPASPPSRPRAGRGRRPGDRATIRLRSLRLGPVRLGRPLGLRVDAIVDTVRRHGIGSSSP